MRHLKRNIEGTVIRFIVLLSALGFLLTSCGDDITEKPVDSPSLKLSGISIPSSITATRGEEVTLTGKGFLVGDNLTFHLSSDNETSYTTPITAVAETSATFLLPDEITSDTYKLVVSRASDQLTLGTVVINITVNTNIPDVAGMTLKGVVYCDGEGVPGVVVSDGYEVTVTNDDGIYYLPSKKQNGYVFISVPGNYEVQTNGQAPQFYQLVSSSSSAVEQKDFSLIKTENTNHVVLAMADWHLASRNNDIAQFTNLVLPDINSTIAEYEAQGKKVYGLTLGDLTWDLYWYSNSFGIGDYVQYMNMVNCPVFNTIGNHDNDPYLTNDWLSEMMYRAYLGPTYYSFNLGNVHYVVLDDVEWVNDGGAQGTVGSRNYDDAVTQNQIDWLEKDLTTITDKNTPIIIASHVPLFKKPSIDENGNQNTEVINLNNGAELLNMVSEFDQVHFLSGHAHANFTVEHGNLIEHNIGAICATWWWTNKSGYSGNHIAKEGSPGGYGVFEISNTEMEWYFKGAGFKRDYQFRAYDLNTILITAAEFAPKVTEDVLAEYSGEYATANHGNVVMVNVWGYEPEWTVEITENSKALDVKRVSAKDPLHIISYEAFRLNAGATPTSTFVTGKTPNLFKATASSATSTVEIKVTDRFGNVFTETMERPKEFSLTIE